MIAVCSAPETTNDLQPSSSATLERMATGAGATPNVRINLTPRSLVVYNLEAPVGSPARIQ